jgi:hypothetical protein
LGNLGVNTGLILSRVWMWLDGFWIDDRVNWTPWCSTWLHFTIHCHMHTCVHSYVFTSRCSVAASNGGRSPSSGFLKYPGLGYHLLTATAHNDWTSAVLWLMQSTELNSTQLISHWLTVLLVTSWHGLHRKHRFSISVPLFCSCLLGFPLLLYPIVAMAMCLFAELLLSNGCCMFAYSVAFS